MQGIHRSSRGARPSIMRIAAILAAFVGLTLTLTQTAFAQNTYVITDGDRVKVHTTFATDPEAVLGEAGFELGTEDTFVAQHGDGVSEITVQRSPAIEEELPVEVILPVPAGPVTVSARETYTADVAYGTTYYYDDTVLRGERKVVSRGVNGEALCQAEVTYVDGVETERKVVSQSVSVEPQKEVIAIGTAESLPEASDRPVIGDGIITLPTGEVLTYTDSMKVLATAYSCDGRRALTYTETVARVGEIAVDPRYIPLGSRLFILSDDGKYIYGIATAEDTGGLIKGRRIDLYYDTTYECIQFGARDCHVYFLG